MRSTDRRPPLSPQTARDLARLDRFVAGNRLSPDDEDAIRRVMTMTPRQLRAIRRHYSIHTVGDTAGVWRMDDLLRAVARRVTDDVREAVAEALTGNT